MSPTDLSIAAKALIRRLVDDLASADYLRAHAGERIGDMPVSDLERAITEYGRTLIALPEHAFDHVGVIPIDNKPGHFAVDVDLWTLEEGRSDLTLELHVIDDPVAPRISIDGLHVL